MSPRLVARADRRLMGVSCTVTATGPDSAVLVHRCLDEIASLELLWSRFRRDSEVSRLNNAAGQPLWVDNRTIRLLHHMIAAYGATDGAFNPALLPLQIAAGDSQSLVDSGTTSLPSDATEAAHVTDIEFLADGRVRFPAGLALDAGGIAKGFAADLVTTWAREQGADAICVNIGGDMAIDTGDDTGWSVEISSPLDDSTVATVHVARGGVATSALNARHRNGGGIASHIFTPDGAVRPERVVGATVIASTAAWAESWTKVAFVSAPNSFVNALESQGLAGMLVSVDGSVRTTSTWKGFVS